MNVIADLAHHGPDNGGNQEARQQAQGRDHGDPAIFLLELLHGQREGKNQADRASKGGGDGLLQQEAFCIVDEHALERGQGGTEDDPGLERVRQPDDELLAQPGDAQHKQQQCEVQGQGGHGLQAQGWLVTDTDGEGQDQGQSRGQPARRIGFAKYDQRHADEYRVDHRGGYGLFEGQTKEHGHQGDQ